jgi:hypothetical protein
LNKVINFKTAQVKDCLKKSGIEASEAVISDYKGLRTDRAIPCTYFCDALKIK